MIGYYISMEINVQPGKYVVAVSGGVDSVVLLDILNQKGNLSLVVAHFDHGIRVNSKTDHDFVQKLSIKYGLPFYSKRAELGVNASEDAARKARYDFLTGVLSDTDSDSIVTAHHQDDLIETATFNLLRGTGRRGLSSLKSTDIIKRPLLDYSKSDLIEYAKENNLAWVEDETNYDTKYSRNFIRHKLLSGLSDRSKKDFIHLLGNSSKINDELDIEITRQLKTHSSGNILDRNWFIMLPHKVSAEIMASWLRSQGLGSFDKKTIDRSVVAAKTFENNKRLDIYDNARLEIGKNSLRIIRL